MADLLEGRRIKGVDPLTALQQKLKSTTADPIRIRVDNDEDADMVSLFLGRNGFEVGVDTDGRTWVVEGRCTTGSVDPLREESPGPSGTLVMIAGTAMGCREDDLGQTLLRKYLLALAQPECLPDTLLLIHEGVCLTALDERTKDLLETLKNKGTQVLFCAESLAFFNMDPSLVPGDAVQMSELARVLHNAGRIIRI